MPRLFIAIDLPKEVQQEIVKLQGKPPHGCRWSRNDQLHLTLRFLGDVNDEQIPKLKRLLSEIHFDRFELQFSETGFFPNEKSARVFWLGFHESEQLIELQREISEACVRIDIAEDDKVFSAHMTLARMKQDFRCRREVPVLHECFLPLRGHRFFANGFRLYASTLSCEGAVHECLQEYVPNMKLLPCNEVLDSICGIAGIRL